MKFNSPLPQPLPKECQKAAKIFHSFVDSANNGLDGVVPRTVLEHAKGFAIFSVVKAGFVFSARAGSGVVIARLDDGSWSAPSAIGTAGVGIGGQAGAEVTDFLIVLNTRSAVKSFMAAGSLTIGGNLSVAVGPLGRNGEASGVLNTSGKVAAMYSYSKTRGLFGGVSLEGSAIVERQDANALAYRSDVTAKMLLSGAIPPPEWAQPLIKTLEACTGIPGNHRWVQDVTKNDTDYAFGGIGSPKNESPSFLRKKGRTASGNFPPDTWGQRKNTGSYFASEESPDMDFNPPANRGGAGFGANSSPFSQSNSLPSRLADRTPDFETHFDSDYIPDEPAKTRPKSQLTYASMTQSHSEPFDNRSRHNPYFPPTGDLLNMDPSGPDPRSSPTYSSHSSSNPFASARAPVRTSLGGVEDLYSNRLGDLSLDDDGDDLLGGKADRPGHARKPTLSLKPELTAPLPPGAVGRAIALYDFAAAEPGDLGFKTGQVITILQKSDSTDDWWRGRLDGREGIFPANFVEVA
ncbi:DUF500-domain-containing protein [Punctularia strigosozonata HHB-11173 SS5]|uniref:DUF500-domain-containing protein n=1 Tax=Punctularia strigosozonata (strain HHB-11173) TaxID=741275 RepID=UPI0004417B47|nr:DUF500-domain-containing protein [Punctularia strigosozonata HHB-11173 SS5]EIN13414.1 DUF500-domain-containing protein [Punctularia strigosozonata HHB-11173 SS5]